MSLFQASYGAEILRCGFSCRSRFRSKFRLVLFQFHLLVPVPVPSKMNGVSSSFSSSSKNLDEAEFPIEYMGTEFQGTDENSVPNSNSVPVPTFFLQFKFEYQELELELT